VLAASELAQLVTSRSSIRPFSQAANNLRRLSGHHVSPGDHLLASASALVRAAEKASPGTSNLAQMKIDITASTAALWLSQFLGETHNNDVIATRPNDTCCSPQHDWHRSSRADPKPASMLQFLTAQRSNSGSLRQRVVSESFPRCLLPGDTITTASSIQMARRRKNTSARPPISTRMETANGRR